MHSCSRWLEHFRQHCRQQPARIASAHECMLACVPAGLRPIAQSPLGPPEHSSIAGRHVIELCTGVCSVWRGVGGVLDPRCRIDRTPRPSHRPAGPGSCPCLVVARGRGLRKPANSNAQSQRRLYSSGSRLRAVYGTYTVCVPVALPQCLSSCSMVPRSI